MTDRDARRWTRLRPDSLTEARVRVLEGRTTRAVDLVDLSPGGLAFLLPKSPASPYHKGDVLRLRVLFRGANAVELPGTVLHARQIPGGQWRLGIGWNQHPGPWDQENRREYQRLMVPPEKRFGARIPVAHVHGLWTRLSILDLSSDRGLRVEGQGGPIWLLPGMEVDLRLDLPVLHELPLVSQVLWVRPMEDSKVQAGLRILDLEANALQALDEWIAMAQLWSPRDLVSRGFPSPSIPGQYRFRTTEAKSEYEALRDYLDRCNRGGTRVGFEEMPPLPVRPEAGQLLVGCWDGDRLVAAIALDLMPEPTEGTEEEIVLSGAGFDPDWFDREILRGLWNQALRLFLASRRERMRLWCPQGREKIYETMGLVPVESTAPAPTSPGGWYAIRRQSILHGSGMNPVVWSWVFAEVGKFHSRQGKIQGSIKTRVAKWIRQGIAAVLSDILLPRVRRKLAAQMELWRRQATGT